MIAILVAFELRLISSSLLCISVAIVSKSTAFNSIRTNGLLCPFCQMPAPTSERERIQRVKKRARANDPSAIYFLGCLYAAGEDGLPKNFSKAMEFWLRAGDLGCAEAYCHAGAAHFNGLGVERDMKKARYYYGLAAMGGDAEARHNIGCFEEEMGNRNKAIEHWMIAAGAGFDLSLSAIREAFSRGNATKDDFETALRAHMQSKDEMKSEQREAAAADKNL